MSSVKSSVNDPESCMSDCSSYTDDDPHCDSNGKEYPNKCKFWNAVCTSGGKLKKKACGKKDVVSTNNDPESCISDCSSYSDDDPHCDSNGKEYPNKCKFYNAVCASGGKLKKKPCGKKDVNDPESCMSDCSSYTDDDPHCGSDGNSYPNQCLFWNAVCASGGKLKKQPCGKKDAVSASNDPESCMSDCSSYTDDDPHCDSDGKEYPNKCKFWNAVCASGGKLKKKACGKKDVMAAAINDPESCMSDCSSYTDDDPHCGSDGNSYPNQCQFWNAVCASGGKLKKQPCGRRDAMFTYNDPESCMSDCSSYSDDDPHCDSNGKEYPNKCKFYNAVCASGGKLKKKPCGKRDITYEENSLEISPKREYEDAMASKVVENCRTDCSYYKAYDPHCATNGKTYRNKCDLYNDICNTKGKIDLDHKGECDSKDQDDDVAKLLNYLENVMLKEDETSTKKGLKDAKTNDSLERAVRDLMRINDDENLLKRSETEVL